MTTTREKEGGGGRQNPDPASQPSELNSFQMGHGGKGRTSKPLEDSLTSQHNFGVHKLKLTRSVGTQPHSSDYRPVPHRSQQTPSLPARFSPHTPRKAPGSVGQVRKIEGTDSAQTGMVFNAKTSTSTTTTYNIATNFPKLKLVQPHQDSIPAEWHKSGLLQPNQFFYLGRSNKILQHYTRHSKSFRTSPVILVRLLL